MMLHNCNNNLKIFNVNFQFLKFKKKTRSCLYLNSMKDIIFLTLLKPPFVSNFVDQQAFTFVSGCNQYLNPTALFREKKKFQLIIYFFR